MPISEGQVKGDKLWHVYRYPQKPNTLMALGSLLTRPDDLESSLNYETGIEPFPEEKVHDQTQAIRVFIRSKLSKSSGGRLKAVLPFSYVASAGAGLSASSSRSLDATIEASGVRAVAVMPGAAREYIERSLRAPKVIEYVRKGLFAEPLYMIVGVATCRKLYIGDTAGRERSGSVDIDASLAVAGVEAGVGASRGKEASAGVEAEVVEECDFAYRVREFQYSRRKRCIKKSADMTEGALFSNESEETGVPLGADSFEEVPIFEYFENEDEDFPSADKSQ